MTAPATEARQQALPQPTAPASAPDRDLLGEILENTSARLDSIADRYYAEINGATGHLRRALLLAKGIKALEAALTDDVMTLVMSLQGSELGFLTDKDKDGGYPKDTVKRCLVTALLSGIYPVRNEFNIIAGKCYIAQTGYRRKVNEVPGLTDFQLTPGVPNAAAGGAVVQIAPLRRQDAARKLVPWLVVGHVLPHVLIKGTHRWLRQLAAGNQQQIGPLVRPVIDVFGPPQQRVNQPSPAIGLFVV